MSKDDTVVYTTERDWKGFPLDKCYCIYAPVVNGFRIWRCNICWNALVESKNELVRENNQLRAKD